ncbi:TPA: hypothetical protein ACH3X1_003940 [Trebouxia sp. C0004]
MTPDGVLIFTACQRSVKGQLICKTAQHIQVAAGCRSKSMAGCAVGVRRSGGPLDKIQMLSGVGVAGALMVSAGKCCCCRGFLMQDCSVESVHQDNNLAETEQKADYPS